MPFVDTIVPNEQHSPGSKMDACMSYVRDRAGCCFDATAAPQSPRHVQLAGPGIFCAAGATGNSKIFIQRSVTWQTGAGRYRMHRTIDDIGHTP